MTLLLTKVSSPLGAIVVAAHAAGVCAIEFEGGWPRTERRLRRLPGIDLSTGPDVCGVGDVVDAYFGGHLRAFDDLLLEPQGTPFDQRVWRELRSIQPGRTTTYKELSERVGCPNGFRAVGAANGRNPLAIAVPCHRVVAVNGELRGYAGGLALKRWLLAHEARFC
jgi:methylated-DNA-[protein]-cysteine S-methyltransferase